MYSSSEDYIWSCSFNPCVTFLSTTILVLQMKKLRHRKMKQLVTHSLPSGSRHKPWLVYSRAPSHDQEDCPATQQVTYFLARDCYSQKVLRWGLNFSLLFLLLFWRGSGDDKLFPKWDFCLNRVCFEIEIFFLIFFYFIKCTSQWLNSPLPLPLPPPTPLPLGNH